jgi:cysteine-rich repeat protein
MFQSRNAHAIAVITVVTAGCFAPSFSTHPVCGPNNECPIGTQCVGGLTCVSTDCTGVADNEACANFVIESGVCLNDNCIAVGCGDGILTADEECDDGLSNSSTHGDACRTNCVLPRCGDNVLDFGEVCDDGNLMNGDGCAAGCKSKEVCGNSIVDASKNEQCDDGVTGLSGDGCSSNCLNESLDWRERIVKDQYYVAGLTSLTPYEFTVAYDSARKREVFFSGRSQTTWEFDGEIWIQRHPSVSPSARSGFAMGFDGARKKTVLFGGRTASALLNDTWEYDGSEWVEVTTTLRPPARIQAKMAFDSARAKAILFGGTIDQSSTLSDTWSYDGLAWVELPSAVSPTVKPTTFVFDTALGAAVMLGNSATMFGATETWLLDNVGWRRVATTTAPTARTDQCSIYDTNTHRTLLFGGRDLNDVRVYDDFWSFDGVRWKPFLIANPVRRFNCVMSYDPIDSKIVVVGGLDHTPLPSELYDFWKFDGAQWLDVSKNGDKPTAMAFDSNRQAIIGYSGNSSSLTWQFDGEYWRRLRLPASPTPRLDGLLAFDTARKRLVLHGGRAGNALLNDTWEFDGTGWTDVTRTTAVPPTLSGSTMVFDGNRNAIVAFGGATATSAESSNTWEFKGFDWQRIITSQTPPPRYGHAMTFDTQRKRMVLFGGRTSSAGSYSDVWEFDGSDWREVLVEGSAPAPDYHRRVLHFDPRLNRSILFDLDNGKTWAFDGSAWTTPIATVPYVGIQARLGIIYDALHDSMLCMLSGFPFTIWSLQYRSNEDPPDQCRDKSLDSDNDGYFGCGDAVHAADPDCWGRCTPLCSPYTTATDPATMTSVAWPASCAIAVPNAPHCGDGVCNADLEGRLLCPQDCP